MVVDLFYMDDLQDVGNCTQVIVMVLFNRLIVAKNLITIYGNGVVVILNFIVLCVVVGTVIVNLVSLVSFVNRLN